MTWQLQFGVPLISCVLLPVHSAPNIIYLSDVNKEEIEFSWTPVASNTNCSSLLYKITSDCGTYPYVTSETRATCSDLQLTTSATECHFRVSSVVCDTSGDPSSPVAVILKGNSYNYNNNNIIII